MGMHGLGWMWALGWAGAIIHLAIIVIAIVLLWRVTRALERIAGSMEKRTGGD